MSQLEKQQADVHAASASKLDPSPTSVETVEIASYHAGPLPDPVTLARFEQVLPGAAKRLFDDFELEASHRRLTQRKLIGAEVFRQTVGSISSAVIGLMGVSGGIWLAHQGKSLAGLTAFIATLASLAGVYAVNQRKQAKDDEELRENKP